MNVTPRMNDAPLLGDGANNSSRRTGHLHLLQRIVWMFQAPLRAQGLKMSVLSFLRLSSSNLSRHLNLYFFRLSSSSCIPFSFSAHLSFLRILDRTGRAQNTSSCCKNGLYSDLKAAGKAAWGAPEGSVKVDNLLPHQVSDVHVKAPDVNNIRTVFCRW